MSELIRHPILNEYHQEEKTMTKFYTFSAILLMLPILLFGQSASINGTVIDAETGEELIGATVIIEGSLTGCSVGMDGNYAIEDLSPGVYTLKCQYISYKTQTISNIVIKSSSETRYDFKLEPLAIALDEINIIGRAVTRTETAMLNLQMKSTNLMNGISASQISKNGDSNVASALKRVTGLSIQDGKYAYVRGLSDRYMVTTLNSAQIPALDPERNTVQLDIFPSNIIENIVVNKSFTPNLTGNFSGGHINIITREFPEKLSLQFSTSLTYNTNSSFNNDFLTYDGSSTDFLGYDNGSRSIPADARGSIPRLGDINNYDMLTSITTSFNKNWEQKRSQQFLNQSYSLSLGNQFSLWNKSLGYIVALSYSKSNKYYGNGVRSRYQLIDETSEELINEYRYADAKGGNSANWSAIGQLSYEIAKGNTISLNVFKNQNATKSARYLSGPNPDIADNIYYQTRGLDFEERSFTSAQLKGKHQLKNNGKTAINWLTTYTKSGIDQPDYRNFNNSYYLSGNDTIYEIAPSKYSVPSRFFRELEESTYYTKADVEHQYKVFNRTAKVQVGASFLKKHRTFSDKRFDFKDQNNSFLGSIEDYFANDNIGVNAHSWEESQLLGVFVSQSEKNDEINSYRGDEYNFATYLMATYELQKNLNLILGARVEQAMLEVESQSDLVDKGELNNLDLLPAFILNYHPGEKTNIRFAYSKTIARPNFRELAPYSSFDFMGGDVIVGNPHLRKTSINNLDLRYEYSPKMGELFALGVFYKDFKDPIEKTYNPEAASPELTWRNVDHASVYGLEIELRKQLSTSGFLSRFKAGLNASFIHSQVNVDPLELEHIHKSESSYPSKRVMAGQPNYILNLILSYNNKKNTTSSNLSFNVSGKRLIIVNSGGTPDIYQLPFPLLNYNISQQLGKHFKLKASINNILNPVFKQTFSRYNENGTFKGKEYLYQSYQKGIDFSIGLSYQL